MGLRSLGPTTWGVISPPRTTKSVHHPRSYTTHKSYEPLRILFCGSDEFSIASLRALHKEHVQDSAFIASIDVVCRPGKPTGRGLKTIRYMPIAPIAEQLGLPLHQIDTFTNWQTPKPQNLPINLIVAVSFGLFVPPRILKGAKYGGLNVHPSMLPETGVTVQTLHHKHFDEGVILAQTPPPGVEHRCTTVPELLNLTANEGANMLVQCLKDGAFNPTANLRGHLPSYVDKRAVKAAPKITPADRHIDWASWSTEEILRRHRVIGPLWNTVTTNYNKDAATTKMTRLIWSSGFATSSFARDCGLGPGQPFIKGLGTKEQVVLIRTCDDQYLKIDQTKTEGGEKAEPVHSCKQAGIFSGKSLDQSKDGDQSGTLHELFTNALV
ncbi:MAG: hypothetical protein Q9217_004087 [Psora testacea]